MKNKNATRQKKPTREQKKMIVAAGLDWHTWSVIGEDNIPLHLLSKKSGRRKVIFK